MLCPVAVAFAFLEARVVTFVSTAKLGFHRFDKKSLHVFFV